MAQELDEAAINAALNTHTNQLNTDPDPEPEEVDPADPDPEDPDPADPDPADPDPEEQPRVSRAQQRIQKLAAEREQERIARERAETEARMLREQLQRFAQPQPREEEPLDPEEKWRRDANNTIRASEERSRRVEAMTADMLDKAEFLTKYANDPEVLGMREEIEQKLAQLRQQNGNAPRENLLKFIMGERALQRRAKAPEVRKKAAERVNQAKGTPLGAKSNVAPSKSSEPTLYERLRDVPL